MRSRSSRRVAVYRYKPRWPIPDFLPEWGTEDAIASIDGCVLLLPTERQVDASELDPDGFLPYGVTPDDVANN